MILLRCVRIIVSIIFDAITLNLHTAFIKEIQTVNFTSEKIKKMTKWVIGIVAICIVIFLGLQNIKGVIDVFAYCVGLISPLILGFVFALILNVPMSFIESHLWQKTKKPILEKLRRPFSFIISLIIIIGIIVGIVWLIIPELVNAIKLIVQTGINYIDKFSKMDQSELEKLPFGIGNALLGIDWNKLLHTMQTWIKNESGTIVNTAFGTVSSLVGGIFDFFISFVFSIYILFGKDKLKGQVSRLIHAWLPEKFGEWIIHASSVIGKNFRNFVSGQTLEAVILGVLCIIGMLILRIPYAPMVGVLVGVTALIPVVGAFIGTIVGAFMILTIDPIKAVIFVIFILVLQQFEGNVIYPKVMGSRVNLPGMWILAAVTVGGGIAGPIGMLLSVPIASTLYILFREATEEREKSKRA